jgi:hypothetical protein
MVAQRASVRPLSGLPRADHQRIVKGRRGRTRFTVARVTGDRGSRNVTRWPSRPSAPQGQTGIVQYHRKPSPTRVSR